jgi:thiol:disulfide interchange protein DsbA
MKTKTLSLLSKAFLLTTLSLLALSGNAEKYIEGKHYLKIPPKNEFTLTKQPEVVEFFYYGCPHCKNIHPYVEKWLKTKQSTVNFHYQPAFYSPRVKWSVQLYYVAFVLKKHNELQGEIFKRYSSGQLRSQEDIFDIFKSVGVDKETVTKTYNSFAVKNLMTQAKKLTEKSEIEGVPSFIVKGKYRVSEKTAGGKDEIFKIINYLLKNG